MSTVGQTTQPQLTVDEMLRVMDVATELRRQRETVEKEFAIDETKAMLRERLLAATSITGERVSETEVDTAISQYFGTLHTFHEPPASFESTLAHLYVRRGQLSVTLVFLLALAGVGWYMLHSTAGSISQTLRGSRQAVRQATSPAELSKRLQDNARQQAADLERSVREMTDRIRAVARESGLTDEIDRLVGELDVATRQVDVKSLTDLSQRTTTLLEQLDEAYEIHIVSGANEKSGVDRYQPKDQGGAISGYYVIVEARDASGRGLTRSIRNAEENQFRQVTRWGERVPKEVYDRIKADKKADGLLDETLFAVKQRGFRKEEIKLVGPDGMPLSRLGQITHW